MEIIESPFRQYAFTLRRTNLKVQISQDTYFEHLEKWTTAGLCTIIDTVFEHEAGLHMHGIIQIPKNVPMKRFRVRGWNMKLEELYDKFGWECYMYKHQKICEDEESYIEDCHVYNLSHSLFKR